MPEEDYDWLDTSDPEDYEIPIEDLDNDYLIDRCILGDFTEDGKWESCQELAFRCNKKMKTELDKSGREKLRQSIIEEISTENELTDQIIEIPYQDPNLKPKKLKLPQRKPSIFDWGYDTDKYIKEHKKTDFGFCNLSLYGLESGFQEEIAELPFQSRKHADMIKNSEKLIFAERAMTMREEVTDKIFDVGTVESPKSILFQKCEFIDMSPFISDKEKYKYCTEANLNDQQNFIIKKREIVDNTLETDTWDKLRELEMKNVWRATKEEYNAEIFDDVAKDIGKTLPLYKDYRNYSKKERLSIEKAYRKYSHDELINMTRNLSPLVEYNETGRLDCYHHFFQYASHPTQAYTEQLKLEAAYEFGDLTKEEYINMLEELKDNTELMKMEMHEPRQESEDIKKLYTKKTEYLPVRYRIWGSQAYLNKIFHETNYWYSLADAERQGGNRYILDTIRKAIDIEDYIGMKERKIYSKKELEMLKTLPKDLTYDALLECIEPLSQENSIDLIEDALLWSIRSSAFYQNYANIMKTLGLDERERTKDYYRKIQIGDTIRSDINDMNENALITIAEGTFRNFEDYWEDFEPSEYMEYFKEKYPFITKEQVYYIFERDLDSPSPFQISFTWDIDYAIAIKLDDLKKMVVDYMEENNLDKNSNIWKNLRELAEENGYEL